MLFAVERIGWVCHLVDSDDIYLGIAESQLSFQVWDDIFVHRLRLRVFRNWYL
jgi:hypothetical protein